MTILLKIIMLIYLTISAFSQKLYYTQYINLLYNQRKPFRLYKYSCWQKKSISFVISPNFRFPSQNKMFKKLYLKPLAPLPGVMHLSVLFPKF